MKTRLKPSNYLRNMRIFHLLLEENSTVKKKSPLLVFPCCQLSTLGSPHVASSHLTLIFIIES